MPAKHIQNLLRRNIAVPDILLKRLVYHGDILQLLAKHGAGRLGNLRLQHIRRDSILVKLRKHGL